jgi:hypothetical protein
MVKGKYIKLLNARCNESILNITDVRFIVTFTSFFCGAAAQIGPRPLHCCGFGITRNIGTPTVFLWGGGEADPETVYNLCLILKTMLRKSCQKSPSRHIIGLHGKLKLSEKENNSHVFKFYLYFSIFHCRPTGYQPISVVVLR